MPSPLIHICYYPLVTNPEDLTDIMSRGAWYVPQHSEIKLHVFISEGSLADTKITPDLKMDEAIAERLQTLKQKFVVHVADIGANLSDEIKKCEIVLLWKNVDREEFFYGERLRDIFHNKKIFEVDPKSVRQEGGNYIDFVLKTTDGTAALVAENKQKFQDLVERLGFFQSAYILATGPSVEQYKAYDFEDSLTIICNSVIFDESVMVKTQPQLLVFADPIFHFGPSKYAAEFRRKLVEVSSRYDFSICIPFKYYPIFISTIPDLRDRTIGIPFAQTSNWNFNLELDFKVKTTANILTFMMMPLACTFAKNIGILGCDGRPENENTYFWKHNPRTQINDQMTNIQEVHPAFFAIDYDDYYSQHCITLEDQFSAAEESGRKVFSLSFSHIPALKKRSYADWSGRFELSVPFTNEIPRVLILDPTPVGHVSATGQIKKVFLDGWPSDSALQIAALPGKTSFLVTDLGSDAEPTDLTGVDFSEALMACENFNPEVIYLRPIDSLAFLDLAVEAVSLLGKPLVIHMMDDWPERLRQNDAVRFRKCNERLKQLISFSNERLCISERMRVVYQERYGGEWTPLANGVCLSELPHPSIRQSDEVANSPFVIRYMGALADDMTYQSVREVAAAVSEIRSDVSVRLEIYTMDWCRAKAERDLGHLTGVEVFPLVDEVRYPELLSTSDALLIAYNFDQKSLSYVGLSLANKIPECLGSGSPVFAYGSENNASIAFLKASESAYVVTEHNQNLLRESIERFVGDENTRAFLRMRGRKFAAIHLSKAAATKRFRETIFMAASHKTSKMASLLGPFTRDQSKHVDETNVIASLFATVLQGGYMIDVGAHHGSSLIPFVKQDWRVSAFEPDFNNREVLIEQLKKTGKEGNVTISRSCVSNENHDSKPFFTSHVSSGISGLSSFHDSHAETQQVDVITLSSFCEKYSIPAVDFLKIDTEGHDLFVLQGYPWEKSHPQVIECEFEDLKTVPLGYDYHDLAEFLVKKGYTVYVSEWHPIIEYGMRHDWMRLFKYPGNLAGKHSWGNFIAFKNKICDADVKTAFQRQIKKYELKRSINSGLNIGSFTVTSIDMPSQIEAAIWKVPKNTAGTWVASTKLFAPISRKRFLGIVSLTSTRSITLRVSLGRDGKEPYESCSQLVTLIANKTQDVRLFKTFSVMSTGLKFQIKVENCREDCEILITNLLIVETVESYINSSKKAMRTFQQANKAARSGDYTTAIPAYIDLYQRNPLPIYEASLIMTARRAQIKVATLADFCKRLFGLRWYNLEIENRERQIITIRPSDG